MLKLETDPRTPLRESQFRRMKSNVQTTAALANPYFRWDIPSENLEVLLHLNVVELAEVTTNRAGNSCAAGVLLGRVEESKQTKIVIEGLEPATPVEGAVESPFKDRQAVTLFLERVQSRSGRLSTLGFYRSCGREGAALNPDDLGMLTCCTDNSRETVGSASTDEGNGRRPKLGVVTRAANQKNAERLFLMIEPGGTWGSNASIYLSRKGMVLWQSPRIPLHRTDLARIGSICQVPGAGIREVRAPRIPAPPSVKLEKTKKRRPLVAVAVIAAVVLASLLRLSGLQGFVTPSTRPEINYEQPIGLQAEKKGADWQIHWNQSSYALRQAKKTRVEIEDGLIRKEFGPSAAELASGTILYSPDTDNVVLTMETESDRPETSFRETVRLISALLPEPTMNDRLPTVSPRLLAKKAGPASSTATPPQVPTRSEKKDSRLAETLAEVRAKTPPPHAPHQKEVTSTSDDGAPGATLGNLPVLSVLLSEPPSTITKRNDLKSAPSEGPQRAELISQTNPVYPEEAKAKHVEGTVEVGFRITSDGDVENVKVLSGDPVLAEATVRAVRGWKYKPARLGGLPAEVPGHVVVKFSLK